MGRSRSSTIQAIVEAEAAPREPGIIPFDKMFASRPLVAGSPEAEALLARHADTTVKPSVAESQEIVSVHDVSHPTIVPPGPHLASAPSTILPLPTAAQRPTPAPRAEDPPPTAYRRTPADQSSAPYSPLAASSGTGSHGRRSAHPSDSADLVLTVMAMLRAEEARDRRREARAAERRAASMPLAPLDPIRVKQL